ncbi:uncharacterized protein UV8b_03730 [Ustilaginoidea virens]|uniref:Reverse transcriptase domain-containing protein n=1 Tax=Ustilaginoidea virens TaxID=1159556 RepID=A0A8E5HPW3_USTVR|nr:uncharacterized protein UV8b_03730 [Ustilaginoidea virens]QUC19489.1 hypothetical protein UV8b_03730 [Ustilaginoidea virens]
MEAAVARRLTAALEEGNLLPDLQMGNRANRSTDAALSTLVEIIRTTWHHGGIASLLQLDISAAFDTIHFEGQLTEKLPITAGVPQGSPLSPILFLVYITPLYERLQEVASTITLGFADDTNIIAYGRDTGETRALLEKAWLICDSWSKQAGLNFNPGKSELIHFTRAHKADETVGCQYREARLVYTQVIRTSIAFGAGVWHTPTAPGGVAKGIAKSLATEQSACLRTVTGAFKATPLDTLETEAATPPIDLYLNYIHQRFLKRMDKTGMTDKINRASAAVAAMLQRQRRKGYQGPPAYIPFPDPDPSQLPAEERLAKDWHDRWQSNRAAARARRPRHGTPAAERAPDFQSIAKMTRLHEGLQKHESAILTQLRTEKIGLNSFLCLQRVPSVPSPLCRCREGPEDLYHIILSYPKYSASTDSTNSGSPNPSNIA